MTIRVHRRTDVTISVTIQDETGTNVDLQGASLTWVVEAKDGTHVITKTTGDGITVTDEANGKVEISVTNADTDQEAGDYRHELLLIDVEGHRHVALTGMFTVLPSLTAD